MGAFPLILLAEDDTNDVFFLRRAFQKAEIKCQIVDVPNGQEAMRYLEGEQPYQDRQEFPRPSLLLLDLKMPMMDGFDVLTFLKVHPSLNTLPVVVLSASQIEEDIARAVKLGARDFLTKPADFGDLVNMVRALFGRWLQSGSQKNMSGERPVESHRQVPGE